MTTELPAVLSRRMDPRAGVSMVWGSLHAGSAANVIPDHGVVTGTVRILDAVAWADCEEVVRTVVDEIVRPYGVTSEIDYQRGVPPVVNEPVSNRILAEAVRTVLGDRGQVAAPQSLGAEDFGWYLDRVPGAMMRLGTRTPGGPTYDLHQGNLRVDERAVGHRRQAAGTDRHAAPSAAEPPVRTMAQWPLGRGFRPVVDGPRSPTGNNGQNSGRAIAQQPCQGLGWRDALPDRACTYGQNDQEDAVKKTARMALVAGIAALALTACGDRDDSSRAQQLTTRRPARPRPRAALQRSRRRRLTTRRFKACMVSDSGGFDDKGFNQTALKGQTDAEAQFGITDGAGRVDR